MNRPPDERVDLRFFGGSHMAAVEVPATGVFTVLVSRRLRQAWPGTRLSTRGIFFSGNPADLPPLLDERPTGARSVVVILPRNMYALPMLLHLRGILGRLFGPEAEARRSRNPLRRRVGTVLRLGAGWVLVAWTAREVRRRLRRYGDELDAALEVVAEKGAPTVVLATPIALPLRRYPGAIHQPALARLIRRRAGPTVRVADVFAATRHRAARGLTLAHDPLHLTPEGHRRVAQVLTQTVLGPPASAIRGPRPARARPARPVTRLPAALGSGLAAAFAIWLGVWWLVTAAAAAPVRHDLPLTPLAEVASRIAPVRPTAGTARRPPATGHMVLNQPWPLDEPRISKARAEAVAAGAAGTGSRPLGAALASAESESVDCLCWVVSVRVLHHARPLALLVDAETGALRGWPASSHRLSPRARGPGGVF